MNVLLFTNCPQGSKVYLSDEKASASYGVPVLVVEEKDGASLTFGASEEIASGLPAVLLAEAFLSPEPLPSDVGLRRARRTKAALDAARRFCETLPLVRSTPAPGYVAVPFGGTVG